MPPVPGSPRANRRERISARGESPRSCSAATPARLTPDLLRLPVCGRLVLGQPCRRLVVSELCRQNPAPQPAPAGGLLEQSEPASTPRGRSLLRIAGDEPGLHTIRCDPLLGDLCGINRASEQLLLDAQTLLRCSTQRAYKHVASGGGQNHLWGLCKPKTPLPGHPLGSLEAAMACDLERFILISTKSRRPPTVMGASKRRL